MIYRIREIQFNENGNICWENSRRTEHCSIDPHLLGKIIMKTTRSGKKFYRVEVAKLEERELLR